jgi:predicted ArsR family transcriptional regulator
MKSTKCLANDEAGLLVNLLDGVQSVGGATSVRAVLKAITDQRVAEWEPCCSSLSLDAKMDVLRSIYSANDPFTDVERRGDDFVLVERNCPYLSAAMGRPEICSTTVNTLRRLTGCEVVRTRRFQDGDGRCEFLVRSSEQAQGHHFEPERL